MKSRLVQLADTDPKAVAWVRENLEVCAHAHALSKELLNRFSVPSGRMVAFLPYWVRIDQLDSYSHGSVPPADEPPYAAGDSPRDQLAHFVKEYLATTKDAVAVCQNEGEIRKSMSFWTWGTPPRTWLYGQHEVYYILAPGEADIELIESSLADSLGHWGIAICSSCARVPERDSPEPSFLDEVAQNTKHIVMPAFDNDGYIIWTPAA